MEKSPMLMDWQQQHSENGHTPKINVHDHCNPYQNPKDILHRGRKINPQIHMEAQKTLTSQSYSEQNSNTVYMTTPNLKNYTTELQQ
jgi:hypothetical protein